jgi:shikimate kinase
VVTLGGGALLDPSLRAQALACAWVVSLRASLATLVERTREGGRPLLAREAAAGDAALEARLADLYNRRKSAYESAHELIDTDDANAEALAAQLLERWHPE